MECSWSKFYVAHRSNHQSGERKRETGRKREREKMLLFLAQEFHMIRKSIISRKMNEVKNSDIHEAWLKSEFFGENFSKKKHFWFNLSHLSKFFRTIKITHKKYSNQILTLYSILLDFLKIFSKNFLEARKKYTQNTQHTRWCCHRWCWQSMQEWCESKV